MSATLAVFKYLSENPLLTRNSCVLAGNVTLTSALHHLKAAMAESRIPVVTEFDDRVGVVRCRTRLCSGGCVSWRMRVVRLFRNFDRSGLDRPGHGFENFRIAVQARESLAEFVELAILGAAHQADDRLRAGSRDDAANREYDSARVLQAQYSSNYLNEPNAVGGGDYEDEEDTPDNEAGGKSAMLREMLTKAERFWCKSQS